MEESLMMTSKEAAAVIGRTQRTVQNLLVRGEIAGTKVGGSWYVNRAALYERMGLSDAMHKNEEISNNEG